MDDRVCTDDKSSELGPRVHVCLLVCVGMVGDASGWRIGSGMDRVAWDWIRIDEKQYKQIDFCSFFCIFL